MTSEQSSTNSNFGLTHVMVPSGLACNFGPVELAERTGAAASSIPDSRWYACHSGSAKANSALPWDDPSILGRNPSAHPPQPLGATMYCRPSML